MSEVDPYDIVIMGGGLAGATLALQLRAALPALRVLVLERRPHPVPIATHKIGESTVEIGAHYLEETLGLREHLRSAQIPKFGFRFFFSHGRTDLDGVTELGVRDVLPTSSWQIDRGILENHLGGECGRRGIEFLTGSRVVDFVLAENSTSGAAVADHRVEFEHGGKTRTVATRWLVDASGRAGLIKRRLDLAETNAHHANAVWFRIDERLAIDDWCANAEWRAECRPPERWRSTNHMVGPGYWVWLIPLSSGAHSVGIVADAAMHPLEAMNTFERALDWLQRNQPLVAQHVARTRDKLMDFAFFRDYSYGCRQVFSGDRWALTGEAGLFLDPFYSPGTDFIAIANTYIVDLVARDMAHQPFAPFARIFEQLYFSFYRNTLALYQDQYPMLGNAEVLPAKVMWDYAYYWGVLCQLVFQRRLTDLALMSELGELFQHAEALNLEMQALFRAWHEAGVAANPAVMLDQGRLPWFHELNRGLHDVLDDAGVRRRLRENVALLDQLADAIRSRVSAAIHPDGEREAEPTELLFSTAN